MADIYNTSTRLKEALKLRNLTPAELARRSGVDKSAICKYMQGKIHPKSDSLMKLADALMVSPAWLLGVDDTQPKKVNSNTYLADAGIDLSVLTKANRNKLIGYYQGLVDSQK